MGFNSDRLIEIFPSGRYELLQRILSRKGLSGNIRLLCSLAYLQAEGDWINLKKVLDLYIESEGDLQRAYEVLLQGYLFCGYPAAIESFFCMNEILDGKKRLDISKIKPGTLADGDSLLKRGETLSRIIHKDKHDKIKRKIDELCPDLGYLMIAEGYGHILCRDGLNSRLRELAVVATLTSLGAGRQLNSHIRGARNVGCEDLEIFETIVTGIAWIRPEKIENSIKLWSDIMGRECPNSIDNIVFWRV
ncbi:MAG: carboxymuconolactone decarboxylase family protein [Candidatus Zixiibacteriota bacterium]|nr:MAG: carboxymuconolactone decarboxylase family protein [candidate division Zixibacteria bacterium]